MKTLTLEVSDEMAGHIETIRDTFFPGENLGRVFDDGIAGWLVESIATDGDDDTLFQIIRSYEFDDSEQAFELANRIEVLMEKAGRATPSAWFTEPLPNGAHDLRFVYGERNEEILDFSIAKGWSFDWIHEKFRLKVIELDEAAGLPPRDWGENPPSNVGEILTMIEKDMESASKELATA